MWLGLARIAGDVASCLSSRAFVLKNERRVEGGRVSVLVAERIVRVGLLGFGQVGQAVAALAGERRAALRAAGLDVRMAGALVRDRDKARTGPAVRLHHDAATLLGGRCDVVVDVMGGEQPAFDLVRQAMEAGAHVVSANKTLIAARGLELSTVAARHGVAFVFDAAVIAGVPFLGALSRRPLVASPSRIVGIINGTSNFIACRIARGEPFAAALAAAQARGYAEPDSAADISGRDAAEKLTILLHLTGHRHVSVHDLTTASLEWVTSADVLGARALGAVIKPIALAGLDADNPGAWVGPACVDRRHALAAQDGVSNAIEFIGADGDPVVFSGPGAGPRVTAATILDDVVEAVRGGDRVFAPGPASALAASSLRVPPAGRWYLRASGGRVNPRDVADAIAASGLVTRSLIRCGPAVVATTGTGPWTAVTTFLEALRDAGTSALALPIIEPRQSSSSSN
jgi:homoserine dehydrogenase